ncbi:hypothetical protein D3C72_1464650 [compost metagenome]
MRGHEGEGDQRRQPEAARQQCAARGWHGQCRNQQGDGDECVAVLGQNPPGHRQTDPYKAERTWTADMAQHQPPGAGNRTGQHDGVGLVAQQLPTNARQPGQARRRQPRRALRQHLACRQQHEHKGQRDQGVLDQHHRQGGGPQHEVHRPLQPGIEWWLRPVAQPQPLRPDQLLVLVPRDGRRHPQPRDDHQQRQHGNPEPGRPAGCLHGGVGRSAHCQNTVTIG